MLGNNLLKILQLFVIFIQVSGKGLHKGIWFALALLSMWSFLTARDARNALVV